MKSLTPFILLTATILFTSITARLVLPNFQRNSPIKPASPGSKHQNPIMNIPNIMSPPKDAESPKDDSPSAGTDTLSISDVIGKERIINIFAGFTRDIDTISTRLASASHNTTVLAPLNSAIQALPRKPWEDPKDYKALGAKAYEGESGEGRAQRNLRRFSEAHIVPRSPWGEGERVRSMGGGEVWWEGREGRKVVMPGEVEVKSVVSRVANGEIWVLKGCLNYQ